jgi:hypothetical protein
MVPAPARRGLTAPVRLPAGQPSVQRPCAADRDHRRPGYAGIDHEARAAGDRVVADTEMASDIAESERPVPGLHAPEGASKLLFHIHGHA